PVPVPINTWFQLEFHLKRAADASGEVALYQDGQRLIEEKNLITDDSSWGQWYVGNFATALTPADFTLYVDDVTISATR
ncbi:MAG TPA: heparin lyase I family protein, partial [Polyangiales bacterium]